MKLLNRYILREHIGPFLFAFFAITFLLIIDYVPRAIDHVIDKNLSIWVAVELIALNLAWMLALSIPMAMLVATLMAFGRMSSDFEIIAMKASGINFIRVLLPLMLLGTIVMAGMVTFNDRILPDLNKRARELWGDIASMRPTLVFRSGLFVTEIPGYLILIDEVDHATSRVTGVRITDIANPERPRIIVADSGNLATIGGGVSTQFDLYDGEVHTLDLAQPDNYRMVKFGHQVVTITGTGSQLDRSDHEYRSDREMTIAMLEENVATAEEGTPATIQSMKEAVERKSRYWLSDTLVYNLADSTTDSLAYFAVRADATALLKTAERATQQLAAQTRTADKFRVELYKKYAIPAASLIFLMIGAPLGILTRRGGMGVAIGISILVFILYWAFLIGGEDLADRGVVRPFWAMWSANVLLGSFGIYLIIKVLTERPVFEMLRRWWRG